MRRAALVPTVDQLAVVTSDDKLSLPEYVENKPVVRVFSPEAQDRCDDRRRRVRRAWSVNAWRGGFRGATVWDELGPMRVLADASESVRAESVLLLGADWCAVDPQLCEALLCKRAEAPESMPLCFSQAPPGLSGLAISSKLLRDLANTGRSFADLLAYNPSRPTVDPISQEFNIAVPAEVRTIARRFIYDTPEAIARLEGLQSSLGTAAFLEADAETLVARTRRLELEYPVKRFEHLPPICDIELTPRRVACGPITPQHHLRIERNDLSNGHLLPLARSLQGHAVTLGGIGEPLLYPDWREVIQVFKDAGAAAVAIQTDLVADDEKTPREVTEQIIDADPDVVFVRLNAESAEIYEQAMGMGRFDFVVETLQDLFAKRAAIAKQVDASHAFPLIVPTLTKTRTTTPSMEHFFERWWQLADHAVIHRYPQGGRGDFALAQDDNPVPMDPPWREIDPHQYKHRLTVLSDGQVSLCHEDWLGRASIGELASASLPELWLRFPESKLSTDWQHDNSPCCPRCFAFASTHTQAEHLTPA
ncbi:MAG: hypothetical protein AAF916_05665 [Planctomycetota bacterium]